MIAIMEHAVPAVTNAGRRIPEPMDQAPKPISSRMHSVLDYLTVGGFLLLPRLLGAKPAVANAVTALALGKLAYTAMTDHEGGIVKRIPLKTHLMLDGIVGIAMAAVPFLLEEEDETVTWTLAGMGLFDVAAVPMTDADAYLQRKDDACWRGFAPLL